MFSFSVFFFICLIMKMLMLLVLVLMTAAKLRKKQKQIIWEYEHVGIFLELLDIELTKIRYRKKLPKEVGRERICKGQNLDSSHRFLEKTGINLSWEPFKRKYDILRNIWILNGGTIAKRKFNMQKRSHREKNEAQPFKEFKEAYEILKSIQGLTRWTDFWWACIKALQHCHGDPSSANPEKNIIRPTMESYKDFAAPSRSELMSLFEEVGYKRRYGKMGDGGNQARQELILMIKILFYIYF
ncbi:BnaCnng20300D [Brassica napus]|uniref:BnaCnng20300D protein n=1 Tax=Brassica napus TaxID=3708 RepID=A0A078IP45_BRANA|nr:BnaCnng20300D [Brassica napus]